MLNSNLQDHLIIFDDGVVALQTKSGNTLKRLQVQGVNDEIVFFKSNDNGLTWPIVRPLLKKDEVGVQYWGGVSQNIAVSAGSWATVPKKITVPAGTYILMAHATIPASFNNYGKLRIDVDVLYETTQSWYASNDIVEVNMTTFKSVGVPTEIGLEITAPADVTIISAEIAALKIK